MSSKTAATIAENRAIFDDRPLRESELEESESGEFALYVAERVGAETDEVHIFPLIDDAQARERVHTALEQLTEDPDVPISDIYFQPGADGRLILSVQAVPCVENFNAGCEAAAYLQSRI